MTVYVTIATEQGLTLFNCCYSSFPSAIDGIQYALKAIPASDQGSWKLTVTIDAVKR